MINKYSTYTMFFIALISLLLIGCSGDNNGSHDARPPGSHLTATAQVYVLKQGESQHVDLTQLVSAQNVASWELTDLDDKSGLGVIVSRDKTSFDYKVLTAGAGFINYTVSGQHLSASSQIIFAVNAGETPNNHVPVASNINVETLNNQSVSIDLRDYISDEDGDTLRVNNLISASGRFTLDEHQVTFTPDGFVGVDQAVYSIDDGRGAYAMAYIAVISKDAAPIAPNNAPVAKDDSQSIDVAKLSTLSLNLSALMSDADGDSLHVVALYSGNGRAKIVGPQEVMYTPGEFRGVDQFSYLISDSRGGYDLATITVHVTDSTPQAPAKPSLAAYPQTFTLAQGQSQRVDLTASVASSNIDSWALTQVQDNSGLGVVSDKTASAFTYLGQSPGVANIGYTVQGSGLTATSEVIVVINAPPQPDNTPPNANNVMLDTVNNRNVKVDLLNYINDEDGDTLNITQLISASGRFSLNGSLVTFAPNGFVGVDQAVYSVEDGKGGYALGHIVATSMDANPPVPNTPPTAKDLDKAIDVATLPVWDIDLSALKLIADADGDALKIVNVYSTDNRAVKQADTRISYTPGAFRGVDQFTYVITDSKNGFAIGVVTVAVNDSTPGNTIPTAEAVEGHMLDNDPMLTLSVADKVHDADGDALQIVSITGALGKATVNPANSLEILYEPNGIVGVDSFVYTVSDGRGGHAMAAVTVKVTHHNPTAPVAGVITAETLLDTPVTIDLSTVISDNETPTSDLVITALSAATSPATATLTGQRVTYTPKGFTGVDVLTYRVSDGLHSTSGTIVVTVTPYGAHDITAADVFLTTPAGIAVSVDMTDKISSTVPSAAPFSVEYVLGNALGDVTITGNTLTYTPKLGTYGQDLFIYNVKDSHDPAHYAQGSITVDITPPAVPVITKLDVTLETGGLLQAHVECERCDATQYRYNWVINGLTVGTSNTYASQAADKGFNIRLDVQGKDIYGQASGIEYATYAYNAVKAIYSNYFAFAALKNDGSVVTWGDSGYGGDSSTITHKLSSGVNTIYSTPYAFAALKDDGSVVTWGDSRYGGDSSAITDKLSSAVNTIYSTNYAFAAVKNDGSVVTWGDDDTGGDSSAVADKLTSGVKIIYSTTGAFAALKNNGSVITWGDHTGGSSSAVTSQLSTGVKAIYSTFYAFAAIKDNGLAFTWGGGSGGDYCGWEGSGGDYCNVESQLTSEVKAIYTTHNAFAAVKNNGSVVTWGSEFSGGNSGAVGGRLSSGVETIYSNIQAFAAVKNDGSVVTWGDAITGGDSSAVSGQLSAGVKAIYSTNAAFAALKTDGSVVTWGGWGDGNGGDSSAVAEQLTSGVKAIYSTVSAFAAIKDDSSVVTWGGVFWGGDSSEVAGQLTSGVKAIYSTDSAFAAVKDDGLVVTWGSDNNGGNSSSVASQLAPSITLIKTSID